MSVHLTWLGVSTFRFEHRDLVVFLDAYMDRVPSAPPVGLSAREVERADFVLVGHSHFDHVWGAETIARNPGCTVVGSYETVRIMLDAGVPLAQLMPVAGGETVLLSEHVRVKVLPSQHSCIWSRGSRSPGDACLGDLGIVHQERLQRLASRPRRADPDIAAHMRESAQGTRGDGGALAYLVETPEGTLYWGDTSGCWTGLLRGIRADVAVLAAAGRPNLDGEPMQGSMADFIVMEAQLLRPRVIVPCHHDDWMPPVTAHLDVEPIARELSRRGVPALLDELKYSDPVALFA